MPGRLAVVVLTICAAAVAPLGSAGVARTDLECSVAAVRPEPSPTRPRYTLTLRVRAGLRQVDGHVSVRFTPERTTDRIVFRLWANSPFLATKGAKLTVGNVRLDRATIAVTRPNPTTMVMRRALAAAQPVVVSMRFRLRMPSGSTDRLYGGSLARLTSFFPLLAWNPAEGWQLDPPSAIGWETWTSPSADFDVRVVAPRGFQVLASGEQVARGRWRASGVRDFALAVGRFTVVRGTADAPDRVRLVVGVERGQRLPARRLLGWARAALEAHARRFGAYPWPTLTLVATDTDRFNWEYPTLVFVSSTEPIPRQATAHEVAHQWFYSLVGNNQARDPWLDETLAEWGNVRFATTLAQVVAQPIPEPVRTQLGQPMSFWDPFGIPTFVDGAYTQGVQALASLGEADAVDCALRLYALENAYAIASPRDLLRALETFFPAAREKLEAYGARFSSPRRPS